MPFNFFKTSSFAMGHEASYKGGPSNFEKQ